MNDLEIKIKNKEAIRIVPMSNLRDCFKFLAHNNGNKIKYDNRYDYVICGSHNPKLLEPIYCPFCGHPDPNVRKVTFRRFMITIVLSNSNINLNNRVAWFDLRYSIANYLNNWELIMDKKIRGVGVTILRKGDNQFNTSYKISVQEDTLYVFTPEQIKTGIEIYKWLQEKYLVDEKTLKNIYISALINGKPADHYGAEYKDGDTF